MKMLEHEGFSADGYVDIFDGGPTMAVTTDRIRTIRESRAFTLSGPIEDQEGQKAMLASGNLTDFAACYGRLLPSCDKSARLDPRSIELLGLAPGDPFLAIGR